MVPLTKGQISNKDRTALAEAVSLLEGDCCIMEYLEGHSVTLVFCGRWSPITDPLCSSFSKPKVNAWFRFPDQHFNLKMNVLLVAEGLGTTPYVHVNV